MKDLQRVLQGKSLVTIFSTSCYSGGWLMNVTGITAAGEDTESSSQMNTRNPMDMREKMYHPTYIQLADSVYSF
ncbi:uncharacterized protein N7518_010096 [Penicillium psychrosexuale]|uniref:uncharacterized protein n=1 Tax=Penicillium psychrosexuale TaxID=1002107 RepID=UPI0025452B19|nr:uncharacterized protein N7518_010096 [Penicillium psychrosexuale]KAJ5781613.1 hypothetical protein N7518_010096 [Penicillium psychrosexuale]